MGEGGAGGAKAAGGGMNGDGTRAAEGMRWEGQVGGESREGWMRSDGDEVVRGVQDEAEAGTGEEEWPAPAR